MPYINVGTGDDLVIELPTRRTKSWNDRYLNNFATRIAEHDHTGSGKGNKIATGAIVADAIDGTLMLLANDQYFRARNNADADNLNIIKANTSDKIVFGTDIQTMALINNSYLLGKNNADSGYINLIKVNASDSIEFGVNTVHNQNLELKDGTMKSSKTFTIADNQTNANVTDLTLTLTEGKSYRFIYGIFIDATTNLREEGEINFTYDGAAWNQQRDYSKDDSLVTFDVNAGQVRYSSDTYVGYSDGTLTYLIIEK